jgi:hypothetical protein
MRRKGQSKNKRAVKVKISRKGIWGNYNGLMFGVAEEQEESSELQELSPNQSSKAI